MTTIPPIPVECLSRMDDIAMEQLSDVLIDYVQDGASVGFMSPLSRERALVFWRCIADDVTKGMRTLLIARDALGICGTVQLLTALPENQPHRAYLAKMLVHRRARDRGVGTTLLQAAEDAARVQNKPLLVLDAVTGGDAAKLYERSRWRRVGIFPVTPCSP